MMTDDRWQVITGDCLDVMRTLAAGSVDAVVTDPPYCSGGLTETQRKSAKFQGLRTQTIKNGQEWFVSDAMTTNGYLYLMRGVANEAKRVLCDGGSLLVFCDWRMYPQLAGALESAGLRLQNLIVWDKGNAGLGRGFRPQHELIAHLVHGTGKYHSKRGTNVYGTRRVGAVDREHPTQKPADLLRELIEVVAAPDGAVLDPFMGSGTTGVACIQTGRRFIGIEIDEGYADIARARIAKAAEQARQEPLPL